MADAPRLVAPSAALKDSYRALVGEFAARGRGLGSLILRLTLAQAARRGIDRVLLTCARANAASAAAIAANGGKLESEEFIAARGEVVQRWWVELRA